MHAGQGGGGGTAHEGVGVVIEEDHDAADEGDEHGAATGLGKADDRVCQALRAAAALDEPRQARQEPREEDDKDVVSAGEGIDDVRVQRPQEAPEGVVPAERQCGREWAERMARAAQDHACGASCRTRINAAQEWGHACDGRR